MKAILITLLVTVSILNAQGPLTPPAAPAPTMKTLDQLSGEISAIRSEPRTPLSDPFSIVTITQPGSYVLTGDLYALLIRASNVTVDFNGYAVNHTNNSTALSISHTTPLKNITLRNGSVTSIGTRTSSGPNPWDASFSGNAGAGINVQSNVEGVRLEGITIRGFQIAIIGSRLLLDRCIIHDCNSGASINQSVVRDLTIHSCLSTGLSAADSTITGLLIRDCTFGLSGSHLTVTDAVIKDLGNYAASINQSSLQHVSISNCLSGITGNNNTLAHLSIHANRGAAISGSDNTITHSTLTSNQGHGLNGDRNIVTDTLTRQNTAAGFSGNHNTYRNVTATANTGAGIVGSDHSVHGAILTNNGSHGIVGNNATVSSTKASSNSGAGIYCDNSSITASTAHTNADDGIRGIGSVIADCRAFSNDTSVGGYAAQGIVWAGGKITNSLADTASPAIP